MLAHMALWGTALSLDGILKIRNDVYLQHFPKSCVYGIENEFGEAIPLVKKFIMILSTLMLVTACGTDHNTSDRLSLNNKDFNRYGQQPPDIPSPLDTRIVEASNQFGLNLFQQLTNVQKGENVFISPISISMALAMAYNGSDAATLDEIASALGWSELGLTTEEINGGYFALLQHLTKSKQGIKVNIANSLWTRKDEQFHQSFLDITQHFYDASIKKLDFSSSDAVSTINRWVEDETKGKIKKIIDGSIDSDAILFLMNAIYFKGDWSQEFKESNTREKSFTRSDQAQVPVQMMIQEGKYEYWQDKGFQAIRLPYGAGEMNMLIILPDPSNNLDSLIKQIAANPTAWQQSYSQHKGEIQLPRFSFEYESNLNKALQFLGMELAFDPNRADFSKMIDTPPNVYINEVKHKSIIEVNEKGSEAAAVTSIEVSVTSAPLEDDKFQMSVDRPFFFAIEDRETGCWIFMGAVNDPK